MSASDELVHLRGGVVVSVRAYLVMLAVEAAGHTITVDGGDLVITPGTGLAPGILDALRTYKPDCLCLAQYIADDRHLQQQEVAHA